jgi:hypothetical protein
MNRSVFRSPSAAVGLITVAMAFFGIGVWRAAADEECDNWCHEGHCWKIAANCWRTSMTNGVHEEDFWSLTGGGTKLGPDGTVTWFRVQTCTKECPEKSKSRAMDGPSSTCSDEWDFSQVFDRYFCGTPSN